MMSRKSTEPIPVLVSGALGKMGREVINAVTNSKDCELVAAIDLNEKNNGKNISTIFDIPNKDIYLSNDLEGTLCTISQNYRNDDLNPVLVDFTHPNSVYDNTRAAIAYGVCPVIGTTGLTSDQIKELSIFSEKASVGCAIVPNFSIGMVLCNKLLQWQLNITIILN